MKHLLQHFEALSLRPKNAKALKGLILQLAIQGKLTAQWRASHPHLISGDHHASQLLRQIKAEKAQMIKAGTLRKEKPLPKITQAEKPFDLPDGWAWCRLGNIGIINPRNKADDNHQVGFIPMKNISQEYNSTAIFEQRTWSDVKSSFTHLKDNDVAFAKITPCFENGKASIFNSLPNGIGAGTTELHVFRKTGNRLLSEFIYVIVKSPEFLSRGENVMTGSAGQKRVPKNFLTKYVTGLPPLAEQKAIVATVNQLFAKVEQLEALTKERLRLKEDFVQSALNELTSAEDTAKTWKWLQGQLPTFFTEEASIKKLREAILQLAVQGRLTARWRRAQAEVGALPESAQALLEKISAEKARLLKEKKIKKEKPLPSITKAEKPYTLPEGWVWCRFGSLILNIEAGKSPKCYPETADQDQWGVIKMSAISWGEFQEKENKTLPDSILPFTDKEISSGDFILTRANTDELIAKSVIVRPGVRPKLLLNDKTLRITFPHNISKRYLNTYNNGATARHHYKNVSTGTSDSMRNISRENIKLLTVSLPPLSEQKAIVAQVDQLMGLCDQLEAAIKAQRSTELVWMQSSIKAVLEAKAVTEAPVLPLYSPEDKSFLKRKLLASYIINQSLQDPHFGNTKFEKLLHLADYHVLKRHLGQRYYQRTAGPFDHKFTYAFFSQVQKAKWFKKEQNGSLHRILPAEHHEKSKKMYNYFSEGELASVDMLIEQFSDWSYKEPEIISTLYAVWNNRLIRQQPITDELLKADFLAWDPQKAQYTDRLDAALNWMRQNSFTPTGWGEVVARKDEA